MGGFKAVALNRLSKTSGQLEEKLLKPLKEEEPNLHSNFGLQSAVFER